MELNDVSLMPFGKFKGKPMQDVPAEYFHWFWHQFNPALSNSSGDAVIAYIKKSMSALRQEVPDLVWEENRLKTK